MPVLSAGHASQISAAHRMHCTPHGRSPGCTCRRPRHAVHHALPSLQDLHKPFRQLPRWRTVGHKLHKPCSDTVQDLALESISKALLTLLHDDLGKVDRLGF